MRHLPNLICLLRLGLVWPVLSALAGGKYQLALALFMLAGVSDGLDGFLAKRFNWTSELGKLLDPAADKILLVCVFVLGAWLDLVPWWLTAAAVARDVLIALGALVFRVWFGPLQGHPTIISKINTAFQLLYLAGVIFAAGWGWPIGELLDALAWITLLTTVLSGADYVSSLTRRALVA